MNGSMGVGGPAPLRVRQQLRLGPVELCLTTTAEHLARWRGHPVVSGLRHLVRRRRGAARAAEASPTFAPAAAAAGATERPTPPDAAAEHIRQRVAAIDWYHTIELPCGVLTPGYTDHRQTLPAYGLPADMHGLRALDVATFDGYWAFEMERRGAEVVATDIGSWAEFDYPRALRALAAGAEQRRTGAGFALAKELLGSRVERRILNVYDLDPQTLGSFDLVFVSDLLLHLRDPQLALEHICSVVRPGGMAIVADVFNPALEAFADVCLSELVDFRDHMRWLPSTATLKQMMRLAGFEPVDEVARLALRTRQGGLAHKLVLHGHLNTESTCYDHT